MPPPSPITLRMEKVRNSADKTPAPLLTTCQSSEINGSMAAANDVQISPLARRSVARRVPSTASDQSGNRTTPRAHARSTIGKIPIPASSPIRPAPATATALVRYAAKEGSCGWVKGILARSTRGAACLVCVVILGPP